MAPPPVATLTSWTFSQHLGYQDQCIRVWHVNTWLLEQHVHELCMTQLWNKNWEPSFSNLELLLSIFHFFFESRWVIFFKLFQYFWVFDVTQVWAYTSRIHWYQCVLKPSRRLQLHTGFWIRIFQYNTVSHHSNRIWFLSPTCWKKNIGKTMWKTSITNFYHIILGEDSNKKQDLGINFQLMVFRCAPENTLRRCDRNGLRCCAFSAWGNWCLGWATHPRFGVGRCEWGEIGVAPGWRKVFLFWDGWKI